jgi:uncharacterized membrane protein
VLGERPGPLTLGGALLVLAGIFLLYRQAGDPSKRRAVSLVGLGLASAAAILWGLGNVFWKLSLRDYSVEQGIWTRALLPAIVALSVAWRVGAPCVPAALTRRGVLLAGATAISGDILGFGLNLLALRQGSVATVVPLFYSSPLFVAVFSSRWLAERVDRWRIAGILAMAAGVAMVALPSR